MKFKSFRIQNYKGIKDITIDFEPRGANIFTLIGLNESGKTSILEAIASFNPHLQDNDEQALYSNHEEKTIDPNKLIPKNQKANFSDKISVSAILELSDSDIAFLKQSIQNSDEYSGYEIDNLSKSIGIEQRKTYTDSNYSKITNYVIYKFSFREKKKNSRSKEKSWKEHSFFGTSDTFEFKLSHFLYTQIKTLIPKIVYFPTFLFNQPEKILLTHNEEDSINKIYTKAIRNLAKSEGLDLQKHVIERVGNNEQKDSLQSALDNMSSKLTETIFSQWKKILQTDFIGSREIILELTQENNDVFINFVIKQGRERFNITERSLGFRWFFLFLLFTLYGSKNDDRKTLFLLDEPASYLHAKAQQALLDSFPKITADGSQIIYSTHSHYLINPHWLEQAYIVANDAVDNETLNDEISKKNVEISVSKYRNYVSKNPTKTTYFQPVLDRLNASVSKLDFIKPSILVEGKSDFLILEYGFKVLLQKTDLSIIPMSGAHGYQGVISLLYGWGISFIACFDDDKAGKKEKQNIKSEYPFLEDNQVITLADIIPKLSGQEISALLSSEDIQLIEKSMNSSGNTKSKIQLFFSEQLAKNEIVSELSNNFKENIQKIYNYFSEKLK